MWHLSGQSSLSKLFIIIFVPCILASENCGFNEFKQSTDCYFDDLDVESSWLERIPKDSIYFIETSCNGDLSYKQACSVEAAARVNTKRKVIVLFAGSVRNVCASSWPISNVLNAYRNAKIIQINVTDYFKGTLLEFNSYNYTGKLNAMLYLNDILPLVTLNKYGGIYVHMDTIVAKPFDTLPLHDNFVGKSDYNLLGTGVIAFSKSEEGTAVTTEVLRSLGTMTLFEALSKSIKKVCYSPLTSLKNNCKTLKIYGPEYFYPIRKQEKAKYFIKFKGISSNVPKQTHAFHVWGANGKDIAIETNSVYRFLMRNYCPVVFRSLLQIKANITEEDIFVDGRTPIGFATYFSNTSITTPHKILSRHRGKKGKNIRRRKIKHTTKHKAGEPKTNRTVMNAELNKTTSHSTTTKLVSPPYPNITDLLHIGWEKEELKSGKEMPLINEFFTMRRF